MPPTTVNIILDERKNVPHLTSRETELAKLICAGLSNPEIAKTMFIDCRTVQHHIASIYFKLKLNGLHGASRVQLCLTFLKAGLVKLEDIETKVNLNLIRDKNGENT